MREKDFIYVDEQAAEIEAMEFATRFAKARATIKWLKESNLPIYWDVLWDCLHTGDLMDAYRTKFAKENYLDISKVQVKNLLLDKFEGLADTSDRYKFPQKFVIRHEDGSFGDIDRDKIEEAFRQKHTYTIPAQSWALIQQIQEAMQKLDINPKALTDCFFKENGKVEILISRIGQFFRGN